MVTITAIGRVNSGDHIVFLLTKMSTRITMITYDHNMVMMVIVNHDIDVCINITSYIIKMIIALCPPIEIVALGCFLIATMASLRFPDLLRSTPASLSNARARCPRNIRENIHLHHLQHLYHDHHFN